MEPTVGKSLAARVKELRIERGYTQSDLAGRLARLGWIVDPTAMPRIEAGQRDLRVSQVLALATALNTSLADLLPMAPSGDFASGYRAGAQAASDAARSVASRPHFAATHFEATHFTRTTTTED